MPPRRSRRRRASWPAAASGWHSRSRSVQRRRTIAAPTARARRFPRCGRACGTAISVTPSPSRAARHIASGSSSTIVSFSVAAIISAPAALRMVRSRIRPVRVERMTMPSKRRALTDRQAAFCLSDRRRRNSDDVQRAQGCAITRPGARLDAAADRRVETLRNQIDLPALELPVGANVGIARRGRPAAAAGCSRRQRSGPC